MKTHHAPFRPTLIAAAFLANLAALAAPANAAEINLRNWLADNGFDVASCVSGAGHFSSYGPEKLFDGVKVVSSQADAQSSRWLADEAKESFAGYAEISVPDSLFASSTDGVVLRRMRVWRYSSQSDTLAVNRAPATWRIYGATGDGEWKVLAEKDSRVEWSDDMAYFDFDIPASALRACRRFKFVPTASHASATNPGGIAYTWQIGAMELELFVEVSTASFNLRDLVADAGVTVADCATGTDFLASYPVSNLFDGLGMDGVQNTSIRWLAGQGSAATASATFRIPDEITDGGKADYVLKGYRLWKNVNGTTGDNRAPTTWVVSGSVDGQFWTELHSVSNSAVTWASDELSKQFEIPANTTPVRYLKFQPLSSASTYEWRVGLHELEYFVETNTLVNIRDRMAEVGFTATDYATGEDAHALYPAAHLFDGLGMDGVRNDPIRWLAGENSLDGVSATLRMPGSVRPEKTAGYAIRKVRLWRNIGASGDGMALLRAPKTYVLEGSNDGATWTEILRRNQPFVWVADDPPLFLDNFAPDNETVWRKVRFRPLSTGITAGNYDFTWKVGLNEIELFGVAIPGDETPFVLIVR